jgi:membrane protease YdiL (CAAX protease family)
MRASAAVRLPDATHGAAAAGATLLAAAAVATWAASAGVDAGRLLVLLAMAPLLEEAVFRAGLHEQLLRRPNLARHANVLTALAFGLAHVLVQGHPLAFAVALPAWLIGLAYERWRRVRYCAALHAIFNALWIAWVVAGPA